MCWVDPACWALFRPPEVVPTGYAHHGEEDAQCSMPSHGLGIHLHRHPWFLKWQLS
jgi:hypothetical protein